MSYDFIKLDFNTKQGVNYLPEIAMLFEQNKEWMLDDYYSCDLDTILNFIKSYTPYFYVAVRGDEFVGVFYLSDFTGNDKKLHSCEIQAMCSPKFYGKHNKNVLKCIIELLFKEFNLVKIKATVHPKNRSCIKILEDTGFKKEGWIKGITLRNGKLSDALLYGQIRKDFLNVKA